MNNKILLIGGGGHCKSVLDSILELNEYSEIGIIDKKENIGGSVLGISIIGSDYDLSQLFRDGFRHAFVTIGSIGNPALRIKLFNQLSNIGYYIPSIIDISAKVSKYTSIEQGVYIGKQCVVNAGVKIQKGAIINSASIVEHDCILGAFSHIAPGSVLGGGVVVGENTHVGSNSTVKQQICIGSNSIIGMGSIVLKNVDKNTIAYGNPCKVVKKL